MVAAVSPQAININDYHGDPRLPLPESKVYEIFYDAVVHLVRNVDETLAFGFRIVNREKQLDSELMRRLGCSYILNRLKIWRGHGVTKMPREYISFTVCMKRLGNLSRSRNKLS